MWYKQILLRVTVVNITMYIFQHKKMLWKRKKIETWTVKNTASVYVKIHPIARWDHQPALKDHQQGHPPHPHPQRSHGKFPNGVKG